MASESSEAPTTLASCLFAPLFAPACCHRRCRCPGRSRLRSTRGSRRAKEGSEPWVQTPEMIEKMRVAGRLAARALAEAGKAVAPGCDHRRAGPHRPRVHDRPRRLPVDARLQGLPEVVLHVAQRDDLPRHPGLDGDRGRRHRQHRRHRLHRRRARRHQRDLPGRRRLRGAPTAGRAHPRGDHARDQGGSAGRAAVRRSGGSSSRTPSASATASFATSPATASAPPSTPAWWCCTTTSPAWTPCWSRA